ncbi:heme peroxidase, partial [Plectosphaerella plurivora]
NSLEHPPPTLLGDLYAYRQADGSFNNPHIPSLGQAGQPYARTVKPAGTRPAALPKPQVIFDLLMSRKKNGFTPHPSGLSSVFFYLASIIIHDLFKTSHTDPSVSLTSSYLDLSPLYGCNQAEQDKVRTFEHGKLKPDCFSEARILGFPPGVGCLLVVCPSSHQVVENLLLINEGNRFSPPADTLEPPALVEAWKKLDNKLFQTGRLIVCGLFVNIILHDYLRVIIGLNRTKSTWCLDPRIKSDKIKQGGGNHCSFEFNLVYRWHSVISQRDEQWFEDVSAVHLGTDLGEHNFHEHVKAMSEFLASIPEQPKERTFGGFKRGPDGRFDDDDLACLWKESVNDPAGAFGPNNTPPAMFVVEILGILQARKWGAASFNEFRQYFGLKPASTFEDINPDPLVSSRLRSLYGHPDHVELYPGLVSEDAKPSMEPGNGLCPPHTLSRAILSDAVALVRGDRFYTTDYHPQSLTNWGYDEVESNPEIDDGCMMNKLLLRSLPCSFKPDSIYTHFPLVTPSTNSEIMESLGRKKQYSFD